MTLPHTPTPWRVDPVDADLITADIDGGIIAEVWSGDGERSAETVEANAALIVRVCNAHDGFVDALKLALEALNTAPRFRVGEKDSYRIASAIEAALKQAGVNSYG